MNGSMEYYLATATVTPILLIAYLFSMNAWKRIVGLDRLRTASAGVGVLLLFGILSMLSALVFSIGGELASLVALYDKNPTAREAWWSIAGMAVFPLSGTVHILCAAGVKHYGNLPSAASHPPS